MTGRSLAQVVKIRIADISVTEIRVRLAAPPYTRRTLSLPQPDPGVLRKAQRGDERAFSLIVRAYETPVFNYVLRLVGDRSLAEDLTQEVFLRVYQGLPKFSLRCRFTTWLFQVTKNRVLDELRASERRPRGGRRDRRHRRRSSAGRAVRAARGDRRGLARGRGAEPRPEDGAAAPRRRRAAVHRDRRLARDHARDGQVADLQGSRRSPARAGARGHHLRRRPSTAEPSSRSSRRPMREPFGQRLRQPVLSDLLLRPLDVVLDAAEPGDLPPRSRRMKAARGSPSRGWPTEPGFISQRRAAREDSVPWARARPLSAPSSMVAASGTWLWPDQDERLDGVLERGQHRPRVEDVLPDRIARARVEELGRPRRGSPPRLKEPARKSRAGSSSDHPASSARSRRPRSEVVRARSRRARQVVVAERGRRRRVSATRAQHSFGRGP